MSGALIDDLAYDSEDMKFYLQEKLILEITELISELMEEKGIRKIDLAQKLGRSKGYITQLLDGRANMTLKTISDVMWALESDLFMNSEPLNSGSNIEHSTYGSKNPCHWVFPKIKQCSIEDKQETYLKKELKSAG